MSRIIVKFKEDISSNIREQHAVINICNMFGYSAPWFNDDAWIESDDRTLILGSGYNDNPIEMLGNFHFIGLCYGSVVEKAYEEKDE